MKRAVASDLGVGFLSRFAIHWEREDGRLVELRVPKFPIRRPLYVLYHRRKHLSRIMRAFLAKLPSA